MARYQSKYFYQGKTLQVYCKEKGFNYCSARNIISKLKKNNDFTDEKVVELTIESLEKGCTKYFYQGKSLAKYCRENDIDNTCVRKRIRHLIKSGEYENLSNDEITKMAIDFVLEDKVMYYIGNQTLGNYCRENEINYLSVIGKINTYKKKNPNSNLSNNSIAELAVQEYLPYNIIYYVDGESLTAFCKRIGKDESTFIRKLKELPDYNINQRKRIDISIELANSIIENIKDPNGTMYYYNGQTLRQYCFETGLSYDSVVSLIIEHEKKNETYSIEDIVAKYRNKKEFQDRLRDKQDLKNKYNNQEFLIYYCRKYNISLTKAMELTKFDYTLYTSINIIHYLGDIVNQNNERSISDDKIKELRNLKDKEEKTLDDLLLLQGLGFTGFELSIVKNVEGLIVNIIRKYNVDKKNFLEHKEYLEEIVLQSLEKDFTLKPAQFITYLQKRLNGSLVKYFYNNAATPMSGIDYSISSSDNIEEAVEKKHIDKERIRTIRQVLTSLNEDEFLFITRKYGFFDTPLTLKEMKKQYYPDSSLEELEDLEINILNKLRRNGEVQKLMIKN